MTQIDGIRAVTLTATPDAEDLGALTQTVQAQLDALPGMPAGVSIDLGGASDDQAEAFRELGVAMLLAIVLVFLIMVATFRSLIQPLILLTSIPFAATGALIGLLVTDTALGVPAMVGLLMLIGIVVTNAIVLVDLINKKREAGEDVRSRGGARRPAAAAADHHDGHRDHLRPDPDGAGADRRRGVHLPAAGRRGDRRSGLLDRADPAAGTGALHPGGEPRREEAAPPAAVRAGAGGRGSRPGLTGPVRPTTVRLLAAELGPESPLPPFTGLQRLPDPSSSPDLPPDMRERIEYGRLGQPAAVRVAGRLPP